MGGAHVGRSGVRLGSNKYYIFYMFVRMEESVGSGILLDRVVGLNNTPESESNLAHQNLIEKLWRY